MTTPSHQIIADKVDEIVAEMKKIGLWQKEPAPSADEEYAFERFTESDRLFARWLQYQFVPRVLRTVLRLGDFPSRSRVSARAAIEFDGYDEDTTGLLTLLREFDALFE